MVLHKPHVILDLLQVVLLGLAKVRASSLGDQLGDVVLCRLCVFNNHILLVLSLHVRLQLYEVVLLRFDHRHGSLRLLLKLALRLHQVSLELVEAAIMHVAHLHLGQGGHLAHLVCLDLPIALLFELGEVEFFGLQGSILLCLFAWDNHLNL